MGLTKSHFLNILLLIFSIFVFCEFLIYYVVLIQCSWPKLDKSKADSSIYSNEKPVRAMLLADTHLLGPRRGHWFDKLRREWQMYRTFQTAMTLHRPELIFVLGDLFDEGLWCSDLEFTAYVKRFHSLFRIPEGSELFVVVGNHDIGFHYGISPYLKERFTNAFNSNSVQLLSLNGVHFVLVNSMAMEGDGCFLCRPAELQLQKISSKKSPMDVLNFLSLTESTDAYVNLWIALRIVSTMPMSVASAERSFLKLKLIKTYLRSTLSQERLNSLSILSIENELSQLIDYLDIVTRCHFPMYRESDEECNEPDEAPEDEKRQKFRERWECLSREATDMLFEALNPRIIVTGHTHHGCTKYHPQYDSHEFTIPSFSWRNKDNPSFMLAVFTPNNFASQKCYMPRESTVMLIYFLGIIGVIVYAGFSYRCVCRRSRVFKVH